MNGQNGYIVPKQNSKALADNLEVLLTDQKLYDYMSQGAKKIFQKDFYGTGDDETNRTSIS